MASFLTCADKQRHWVEGVTNPCIMYKVDAVKTAMQAAQATQTAAL